MFLGVSGRVSLRWQCTCADSDSHSDSDSDSDPDLDPDLADPAAKETERRGIERKGERELCSGVRV